MPTILRTCRALAAGVVICAGPFTLNGTRNAIPGVRFTVDTAETKAPATGLFAMFVGRVEFAAGRGRIDVSAVLPHSARSVNDVTIGPLLARPGDYYLFDSTGYILVRPTSRSFSQVSFTASTYRHGNVREPWDDFFEFGPVRREDIPPADSARLSQHGAFGVRWHLDRRMDAWPTEILARGRVLVADAPRGEAGVVRWMGVAASLATLRDSVTRVDSSLQVTAVAVLPPQSSAFGETNLILLHPMSRIADTDVDVSRLVLPAGYVETPWPGFEHASNLPRWSSETADRWRTFLPGK
jgi:hypothetical protein